MFYLQDQWFSRWHRRPNEGLRRTGACRRSSQSSKLQNSNADQSQNGEGARHWCAAEPARDRRRGDAIIGAFMSDSYEAISNPMHGTLGPADRRPTPTPPPPPLHSISRTTNSSIRKSYAACRWLMQVNSEASVLLEFWTVLICGTAPVFHLVQTHLDNVRRFSARLEFVRQGGMTVPKNDTYKDYVRSTL